MDPYWEWVSSFHNDYVSPLDCHVITFDNQQYVAQTSQLKRSLYQHGGGGTMIPEAFSVMENYMNELRRDARVTVLFISDGEDNRLSTLEERMEKLKGNLSKQRQVNFICIGIGKKFPHLLSMRLRQLYHNGDENIPALYLIEYPGQKAFFNKFESIRQFLVLSPEANVLSPIKVFPWENFQPRVAFQGQWVISQSSELFIEGWQDPVRFEEDQLRIEDVQEIVKGWYQKLQMVALNQNNFSMLLEMCVVSKLKIEDLFLWAQRRYGGIDLRSIDAENIESVIKSSERTLYDRCLWNYLQQQGSRIVWFYNEIVAMLNSFCQSKKLDEFEQAKKMNLATLQGKYFQKIMALRRLRPPVFQELRAEFLGALRGLKLEQLGDNNTSRWR